MAWGGGVSGISGSTPPIAVPTADELASAVTGFGEDWGAVDEVLYRACCDHPKHDDIRAVMCKMVVVNRCYSAGLERLVEPKRGGRAVDRIAACLVKHGEKIDAIIEGLPNHDQPLSPSAMKVAVRQHGRLTRLLAAQLTQGRHATSFVSKYLHFHKPIVPIYDADCLAAVTKAVRWDRNKIPFGQPGWADQGYYWYCVRFMRLCAACQERDLDVSVKDLDAYLWQARVRPGGRRFKE